MRRFFLFLMLISVAGSLLMGQTATSYRDDVRVPNVKSIKFHHEGLYTSEPIIDLGSSGRLILSFDDLLGGDITYKYRIIHCTRDWQPSDIDFSEYMEGFNDGEIRDWYYSSGTKADYTHYRLALPNDDVQWRVSGNYVIEIIDTEDDVVAFTRRFMVVDPSVRIRAEVLRALRADEIRTHQRIEMTVNHKDYPIQNPQQEISACILPNGRWDQAMMNVSPQYVIGEDINFDRTSTLTFPAGREYRPADLRSLRSAGVGMHRIERRTDGYDVLMLLDEDRSYSESFDYRDLNGSYVIETLDRRDHSTESDYADVHFGLVDRSPDLDGGVYVIGEFSDWQCRPEHLMVYDTAHQGYYGSALLKQGFYDYQYVRQKGAEIDYSYYEGDDYQTTNEYTILIYQRAFADRFDRLIGVTTISSEF